jgi:hypothetical protein
MIMKQFFNHAFLGAIALTGAVCFSACSSKDDLTEEVNPTYDPVANTVKTDFTIALTSNVSGGTRMGADETQSNIPADRTSWAGFKGIKNITLIPFDAVTITEGSTRMTGATGNITLSAISGKQLNSYNNSFRYHYLDVEVPATTASMLFYGLYGDYPTSPTADNKFQYGSLVASGIDGGNTSSIGFALDPIISELPTTDPSTGDPVLTSIVTYLNNIASAEGWSSSTDAYLKDLYDKFISLKSASSANVRYAVQDLYTAVKPYLSHATLGTIYTAIKNAIADGINASINSSDDNVLDFMGNIALTGTSAYPQKLNLPDGAAIVKFNSGAFSAPQESEYGSLNAGVLTKYVYPASLYYFANSPTMVSNTKRDAQYNANMSWEEITATIGTTYFTVGAVTSSTRDVALQNQIEYAVGKMDLTVKTATGTLYDSEGNTVTPDASGFPVTGVLIGCQRNGKFDFTPVDQVFSGTKVTNEYTIYDNKIPTGMSATAGTASTPNYTLVLESGQNQTVYIAVEFTNNSTTGAFRGVEGIIPAGGKFYLVAELSTTAGTGVTVPTGVTSVFKKDYNTTVALTIGNGITSGSIEGGNAVFGSGLGAAYNYIPDLGTPAMRLGFSVDLNWTQGIDYDITL